MTKRDLKERINGKLKRHFGVTPKDAKGAMIYHAMALAVRDILMDKYVTAQQELEKKRGKQLYYLSIEFLLGRSLRNHAFNLGILPQLSAIAKEYGTTFDEICMMEHDAALGNGGLGRLAACYMDATASQGLPATGCSILYEYGLFKQRILEGQQTELPDSWLDTGRDWLITKEDEMVEVHFGGTVREEWTEGRMQVHHTDYDCVYAVPNDMLISGYDSGQVNTLRLWQPKSPYTMNMTLFNEGAYLKAIEKAATAEVLSKVLYPEDNNYEGKSLRIKQQYFCISASVQSIVKKHMARYKKLSCLPDKVVIQINDTHPAMVIPELMRIMMDEYGLGWEQAWDITTRTVAYTNHTIMVEALERWPEDLIRRIVPRIYQIIQEINRRFTEHLWTVFPGDENRVRRLSIIDRGEVRMANLSVAGSFSVNGVSELHSRILREDCFRDFYVDTPEKFRNVTNGIAYRRWLAQGNPGLAGLLKETIGEAYLKDPERLQDLLPYQNDKAFLERLEQVKKENKQRLARFVEAENGILIDPDSLFDAQAKRLHEYKRQLMNVMHILRLYFEIKDHPSMEMLPRTFLFGAKAAPGYSRAKEIIRLIHAVADMVNHDPEVKGRLKVVFIQDYRVSVAEVLMPAANLSEQISTAGREASGTGNMKFMLNGAVTIGTFDGANVEIVERVGEENFFLFGLRTEEVNSMLRHGYDPMQYYVNNAWVNRVVSAISQGVGAPGQEIAFPGLANSLLFHSAGNVADPYLVLADFEDYCRAQQAASEAFKDPIRWNRMALVNIAQAGVFAADRSVRDYNERIWNLTPLSH